MSKIKKHDEYVSHFAYITYFKDEGMYKVKASVHVTIDEGAEQLFHEVTDVELEFFVNDKKCKHAGFSNMYEELFGKGTFDTYYIKLQEEFEAHYLENKVKL